MGIQKERDESGEGTLQLLRYWSFSFLSMWGHGCSHYRLCWFLPAAATKYHRLGGLKTNLFSHSSRGCKSKIKMLAALVPSKVMMEGLFYTSLLASGGLLAFFGLPWLVDASPWSLTHLHTAFSLCLCLFTLGSFIQCQSHCIRQSTLFQSDFSLINYI